MATLAEAIRKVAQIGQEGTQQSGSSRAFIEQGDVTQVDATGGLLVSVGGRTVFAKPVTDEPYRVGAKVWVSEASDGWIVHGGVR